MSDIQSFAIWYLTIQLLGLSVWPLARRIFKKFPDRGWAFSKILGIIVVTYVIWMLGSVRVLPFTRNNAILVVMGVGVVVWAVYAKRQTNSKFSIWRLVLFEELLFIVAFAAWSYVRAQNPDIRGLEKFMDHGFIMTALRGKYFPPLDHFLSGYTINYYYFGHLMAAVITRLTSIKPAVAFNLQIANLFALTVLESFVVGCALFSLKSQALKEPLEPGSGNSVWVITSGLLSTAFVALIGNFHLLREYLAGRIDSYWYASASRVIPYTINEFPVYSFVVADLHGHVNNLPVVLLFIGALISFAKDFFEGERAEGEENRTRVRLLGFELPAYTFQFSFFAFLLGVMYVTNTWDFLIYFGFLSCFLSYFYYRQRRKLVSTVSDLIIPLGFIGFVSVLLFLPYWLTVKLISQGVGLVHSWSPLNLILILWGFYFTLSAIYLFWFFRGRIKSLLRFETLVLGLAKLLGIKIEVKDRLASSVPRVQNYTLPDLISFLFISYALVLIIAPEVVYVKDIYRPDYYRANTMFKLYYQAWVLFAFACAYGSVQVIRWVLEQRVVIWKIVLLSLYPLLFFVVGAYPHMAIQSNYKGRREYRGLDGNQFLEEFFPYDALAINWINENISSQPVIVEAVGESYTDYSRICANTGLPAVLGWPVHEWLWRGGWDLPGGRQADVGQIYESQSEDKTRELLDKYQIEYVYVGGMEREKYPNLQEVKFQRLGELVYDNEGVRLYYVTRE